MPSLAQENKTPFATAFEALDGSLPGAGSWLDAVRLQAFQRHLDLGLPTKRTEGYRYTSLAPVRNGTFEPVPAPDTGQVTADALDAYRYEKNELRLVFVDGHLSPELSTLDEVEGLTVRRLATVLDEDPDALKEHLTRLADYETETWAALNTALFTDGAVIEVAANAVVERLVHVLYVTSPSETPTFSSPRLLLSAGTSSELKLVETHVDLADDGSFTNAVSELVLGANATVHHVRLQRRGAKALQLTTSHVETARDATYNSFQVDLGATLVRNQLFAALKGEGAHALVNGVFMPTGDQHVDNFTQLDHIAAHCTSHELYKGILDDEATGVFRGRIFVEKGAQKTDAIQHNPNLLLSDTALVNSLPQLEIYADDVKCTHGSTIGQLEEDQLFYLQARGIDRATAKSILTYAFAREALLDVEPKSVRQVLSDLVLDRLPNGRAVQEALE